MKTILEEHREWLKAPASPNDDWMDEAHKLAAYAGDLEIDFAQLKEDFEALLGWIDAANPIEGRQKWDELPAYIRERVTTYPTITASPDTIGDVR